MIRVSINMLIFRSRKQIQTWLDLVKKQKQNSTPGLYKPLFQNTTITSSAASLLGTPNQKECNSPAMHPEGYNVILAAVSNIVVYLQHLS